MTYQFLNVLYGLKIHNLVKLQTVNSLLYSDLLVLVKYFGQNKAQKTPFFIFLVVGKAKMKFEIIYITVYMTVKIYLALFFIV